MERWEEGGMVRGGIIGWETGGGEGGIQGKKGPFQRAICSQSIQRDFMLKMKCRTAATDRYSGKIYCRRSGIRRAFQVQDRSNVCVQHIYKQQKLNPNCFPVKKNTKLE